MTEGLERQRGNRYYNYEWSTPITLCDTTKIDKGESILRAAIKCGDKILANRYGYIGCFDMHSHDLLWSIDTPGHSCQDMVYNEELYLSMDDEWLAKVDVASGEQEWRLDVCEPIKLITENFILTSEYQSLPKVLYLRSKEDGSIIWSFDENEHGSFRNSLSENGILVVKTKEGCRAFDENTGNMLWKFSFEEWQRKYVSDRQISRTVIMRLLVDGIFYLSFSEGFLTAINASTGELSWIHQVKRPSFLAENSPLVEPMAVIYRNGELLFTINQGRGYINYLSILDATNGELVFQSDGNVTQRGCQNPFVINNYFVGAYERHLSVFDIDKREFVWRYKYPKTSGSFGGPIMPFDNGFVVANAPTNSLHWFAAQ